ncbi:MAG: DUF4250 domain-containing protein [Clostridia bacterium]|nr:DUF4250 domain-containing protein [Clostridia bacterium]
MLPKDKYILLSYLNTKLRDEYSSLDELCRAEDADIKEIVDKMADMGYMYSESTNSFTR